MESIDEIIEVNGTAPRACDIVLKGGVASGFVYPKGVCAIAKNFHPVGISGTSAGAIVASLVAAAEYQRRQTGSGDGYRVLQEATNELMRKGAMLELLGPDAKTKRLWQVAVRWRPRIAAVLGGSAIAQATAGLLAALVIGSAYLLAFTLIAALLRSATTEGFDSSRLAATAAVAAFFVVLGSFSWIIFGWSRARLHSWVCNHYGLASGMANGIKRTPKTLPLSRWLHTNIQLAAGRSLDDDPLTFGDLHSANWPESLKGLADPSQDGFRAIDFRVMTSCLTLARPFELPMNGEANSFSFRPLDLQEVLPRDVVDFMGCRAAAREKRLGKTSSRRAVLDDGSEVVPFPGTADLPVVLAARMSLSFPALLSMVPLWSRDHEGNDSSTEPATMRRVWFSDGGITSNMPVHAFDAELPRWPTLAINLEYDGLEERPGRKSARMPAEDPSRIGLSSNRMSAQSLFYAWNESNAGLKATLGFVMGIFRAAQTWHDKTNLAMPSYRDRVVEVWLNGDEGGLNLEMSREDIEAIHERGYRAATALIHRFDDSRFDESSVEAQTWDEHRWARFRSAMSGVSDLLERINRALNHGLPESDRPWKDYLELPMQKDGPKSYSYMAPSSATQQRAMLADLHRLQALADEFFAGNPRFRAGPEPRSKLVARLPLDRMG